MQKHVNLVDLVKSFPTNIYLQNLASIEKRTSPVKFAYLAEKSGKGSISNLSAKTATGARGSSSGRKRPTQPSCGTARRSSPTARTDAKEQDVASSAQTSWEVSVSMPRIVPPFSCTTYLRRWQPSSQLSCTACEPHASASP